MSRKMKWQSLLNHAAGYLLLGIVCYWFNSVYRLASPNLVAGGLLSVISAALIYKLAGLMGLRLWTRRGAGDDSPTPYQPPSDGGRSD